jgi:CCR4-NOT transcriptional complex subunit CAF120
MPSSSPQWDSRNRGFISPAELQQLRQGSPGRGGDIHDFPARPPSNDPSVLPQDTPNDNNQHTAQPRPMPPPSQSHARTSSFFSFRSKPHQEPVQDTSPNSPSLHSRRPSNPNGASPTDFGGPAPQMGQSKSLGPTRSPTNPQVDQQQPAGIRRASLVGGQPASAPLHPEIRSVVQLTLAHARKVYFSGPLVKRLERQPDGQRPHKDDGWVDVWAQLGGTTLSIWDMREVEEANKQGKEVPPTYFNTTDAVRFRLLVPTRMI